MTTRRWPTTRRSGAASGSAINSMVRFGLAFGSPVAGTLLTIRYRGPDRLRAAGGLSAQDRAMPQSLGAINVADRSDVAGLADAARDAYVSGFQLVLVVAALVLLCTCSQ